MFIEELTPFWWFIYRWTFLLLIPCAVLAAIGIKTVANDIKAAKEEARRKRTLKAAVRVAKYHENQGYGYYL